MENILTYMTFIPLAGMFAGARASARQSHSDPLDVAGSDDPAVTNGHLAVREL